METNKSLFASFSSEKEGSSLPSLALRLDVVVRVEVGERAAGLLERLVGALAGMQRDDRQPGGVSLAPATQAPCPAPAAEAGAPAAEGSQTSPPPVVHPSGRRKRVDSGHGKAAWKTPEREAMLRREWESRSISDLAVRMAAVPGAPLPRAADVAVANWRKALGLPDKSMAQRVALRLAKGNFTGPRRRISDGTLHEVASWAEVLEWADQVDPDMVLRGTPAERLAQVNDLRAVEGKPPFLVREVQAA